MCLCGVKFLNFALPSELMPKSFAATAPPSLKERPLMWTVTAEDPTWGKELGSAQISRKRLYETMKETVIDQGKSTGTKSLDEAILAFELDGI